MDEQRGPTAIGSGDPRHQAGPAAFGLEDLRGDADLVDTMTAAVQAEDPGCHTLPYMMSGGTDAKAFEQLGMRCFGFSPLRLPPDLDFASLFHGIDERVPVESLQFGIRVLDRFLRSV